jgi:beta-N-acetylhexosaminidase
VKRSIAAAIILVFAGSACVQGALPPAPATPASSSPAPTPTSSVAPPPSCAETVLAHLTRAQLIGQLFMLGLAKNRLGPNERAAIRKDHFGSVWFVDNSSLGIRGIGAITDSVQALAQRPITGDVRFFIAANQEGGVIQALKGAGFSSIPAADQQGRIDPQTLESEAMRWGRELAAAGVNFNFAPVFDVVPAGSQSSNAPIGALHREYGNDVETVSSHALAFARAMTRTGIATSAKHYPGLGRVQGNTDNVSDVIDDVTTTSDVLHSSFARAATTRIPFMMVALATYTKIDPDHLAVFSPLIVGRLLRNKLHFGGVVISDDLGATAAVSAIPPGRRAIDFLDAGGDMIISKTIASATAMHEAISSRMDSDRTFAKVVSNAALLILRAKDDAGLLPCSKAR